MTKEWPKYSLLFTYCKRRVLNPSTLGLIWGKTIDSESDAFLDEVMGRIRSYLEDKGNVTDFIPQSSLRKTSDLSLPLRDLGLKMHYQILITF